MKCENPTDPGPLIACVIKDIGKLIRSIIVNAENIEKQSKFLNKIFNFLSLSRP